LKPRPLFLPLRSWKMGLTMIDEFISRGLALRDASHLAHWSTRSYAEHVALGDFYEGLLDHIDGIVEAYQGAFGLIKDVKPRPYAKADILAQIVEMANWIASNKDEISRENEVLENKLDELGALFASTVYKLRFLS